MCDFLQDLNENQREAVKYLGGPQLVIAGAGSGKTRVLTYKIAYLLSTGMKPENILALTFTNKAADEMKRRVGQLTDRNVARHLYMGTFHSIFYRILRTEYSKINYKANFTIYDESDSVSLIKSIIKEFKFDDNVYKPAIIRNIISMAKNHLITADDYSKRTDLCDKNKQIRMPRIADIYIEYVKRCHNANAMDFDDLLINTYRLFEEHPDTRKQYSEQFKYVLVDEYQDTNYAQQRIVEQLTKENRLVCMVGDDAQSIYSFRGANLDYMLNFSKNAEYHIFKLEQNYRSTQYIVKAANSLINHNKHQIYKNVYSENGKGEKLIFKPTYSDDEETSIVCKEIRRLRNEENCQYDDFCILYRTNAQSRKFEEEFIKQTIPYRIYGGLSFYQRKEIKDIIAYFRVVVNPDDEESLKRIINYPARGIGATTLKKLTDAAKNNDVSLWEIIKSLESRDIGINKGIRNKLTYFYNLISEFINKTADDAYELGKYVIERSGIMTDIFSDNSPENLSRRQNIEEFQSALKEFVDKKKEEGNEGIYISDFLQEVSLMSDMDQNEENDVRRVSLMTVHSAKGLEFSTVFVVGLEENIFPSIRSCGSLREIEEERRLLYVAITRARKHCILTCARSRYIYGKMEFGKPSRFISEIDPDFITVAGTMPFLNKNLNEARTDNVISNSPIRPVAFSAENDIIKHSVTLHNNDNEYSSPKTVLQEGAVIEHQRFGIGTVIRIEGKEENAKATVQFLNTGTKQLLLKFARYKIISE